jgi:acyl-CoA dehydrogenase
LPIDDHRPALDADPVDLSHLSWPFFDSSCFEFAGGFDRWVSAELGGFEQDEGGDGRAARRIFESFAGAGWLRATLPTPTPGQRRKPSLRHVSLMREISAFSSAIADVALSEPWLGILPIALYGSQELRDELLPGYLAGKLLPAFALSEPDAGSDAAAITTTAYRDGNHYVINGRKTWTSNCGLADLYVVFARIEGQAGAGGIAAFAIDGRDGGIALEERLSVMPPHTVGTWTLTDCRVPSRRLIGEVGQGFKIALHALELFRPTVGAATLGFARRAMAEAIERSVKRTTFKKPISEHQLIQAKLADMAVGIDAAALLVYRAAWQHDATERSISREAAIAKLYSTETAFDIIDQAMQIFGGLGVIRGTTVERLFRHSRAFRIFDGTSEIQQLIIARNLLQNR